MRNPPSNINGSCLRALLSVMQSEFHHLPLATCHWPPASIRCCFFIALSLVVSLNRSGAQSSSFVHLEKASTTGGYLARLLINETPFPGERGYESEINTKSAMLEILWVLHARLHLIPEGYTQEEVAGVSTSDIIDVITGTRERPQCEGFYRNDNGQFVVDPRVEERVENLLWIANGGGRPGRFAALLNYAQGLANAYVRGGIEGADRYAGLRHVGRIAVTGHPYSWMTDIDSLNPGGNFVAIPHTDNGSLGGNRFFTLRKVLK